MRLNYYWAVFQAAAGSETQTLQVCDFDSHPFIWMRIQKELYNRDWVCLNWKEISEKEYAYYSETVNGRY